MQLLHKIAAIIYCDLVVEFGLKLSVPHWLFNKPDVKLEHTYTEFIHADINFTEKERDLIRQAARNLEWFCNGFLQVDIEFDWDPIWKVPENAAVILRVPASDTTIAEADGYFKNTVLGLCSWTNKHSTIIHLVHDRLENEHTFRTTALHELGHYMGMSHTAKPSIMYKSNYTGVLYMTYKDAVEFGRRFGLNPEYLRYFKL